MPTNHILQCDFKSKEFNNNYYNQPYICLATNAVSRNINYLVYNLKDQPLIDQNLEVLNELTNNKTGPIGKHKFISVFQVSPKTQIHFINAPPKLVRKVLFNDSKEYPYDISFKIVQYHVYMSVREKETNAEFHFGLAPKTYNSIIGTSYIRNETLYNLKHFVPRKNEGFGLDDIYSEFRLKLYSSVSDLASTEVVFDLTTEQVKNLELNLEEQNKEMLKEWYQSFKFYFVFSHNCSEFANQIFQFLFNEGHFGEYLVLSDLDLYDKGVVYTAYSSYPEKKMKLLPYILNSLSNMLYNKGSFEVINDWYLASCAETNPILINVLDSLSFILYGKTFIETLNKISIPQKWNLGQHNNTKLHCLAYMGDENHLKSFLLSNDFDIDSRNQLGETPLHIAVDKNIKVTTLLLEHGANPNFFNKKGLTPLHSAITSTLSNEEKYNIVETLLEYGSNPNYVEVTGFKNALVKAIEVDNLELFNLLLSNCYFFHNIYIWGIAMPMVNIGIYFTDPYGKNLARIAVDHHSKDIKNYLKANYPRLFDEKAKDGFTATEFEEDIINGGIKYKFETIKFPFKNLKEASEAKEFEEGMPTFSQDFAWENSFI